MSFITKRERVFNEYDLFDLPARNEGKLKTFASCTDARAWSHFCSDKSEHLAEIIKRNNETMRPKYLPTDVIVNTLMTAKNAEIARLKRKIEEFEQLLNAYDQLDLTCDQKCDIANAHAAIQAANKELDDMCLELDLSGFTEGIDSEAFETGKSRGDEPNRYLESGKTGRDEVIVVRGDEWSIEKEKESTPRKETKSSQAGTSCTCDASTSAHDAQVEDMQETIITKDAKLSAMQNTIAVMEHDVCEPYCVYAHIYTALEKIFATLCQNGKYKQYLDLLTAGKDTRSIDIKGKIIFKLKVLEKFSLALIAPCSQDFSNDTQNETKNCSCYRAEVVTHVETTFALTSAENIKPSLDNKRAQLVADIMENQEMKEILSKDSLCLKIDEDQFDECSGVDNYNIDVENLSRLKNLQTNYDELVHCYDNLKYERDCLYLRCRKLAELENECDCLKNSLREYNQLWKEKEYYQKRSEDLDTLKEKYFILSEETLNVETKLKAEQEINKIKSEGIDELRKENIKLEQKIGEASVLFEKQKNILICKLKECECKVMCQEQQIKSLSLQIDKLLEQDRNRISSDDDKLQSIQLIDEIESQKEQIQNLKDALCCSEEEKEHIQEEFEKKLELINELKLDVEDWKREYEKALQNNNYLQKYINEFKKEVNELQSNNLLINQELESKTSAIENLNNIISSKSHEISTLEEKVTLKKDENMKLVNQMKFIKDSFDKDLNSLKSERKVAMSSILIARQESEQLLSDYKHQDDTIQNGQPVRKDSTVFNQSSESVSRKDIKEDKDYAEIDNDMLIKGIDLLQETNLENIKILRNENAQLKKSLNLAKNESQRLEQQLLNQDNLLQRHEELKQAHEQILKEKEYLQHDLNNKNNELDKLIHNLQLTKNKSEEILGESNDIKEEYSKLKSSYQKVANDRSILQKLICEKDSEIKSLLESLTSIKIENDSMHLQTKDMQQLQQKNIELQNNYQKLSSDKTALQNDLDNKNKEFNNLYNNLQNKIEENQHLYNQIKKMKFQEQDKNNNISALKTENSNIQLSLNLVKKESAMLLDKIKHYENVESEYNSLKLSFNEMKLEKENLLKDLNDQLSNLNKLQQDNNELNSRYKNLLLYNENLEESLTCSRNENTSKMASLNDFYNDVKKELEHLKEDKLKNQQKIKELMEKLDESEYFKTNLTEDIVARDKRISTLENHINDLEVEIRALQRNLIEVVESGEQLKELSNERLDQSVKKIEAHQSKATHNMRLELTKLQTEKANLEGHLSSTKLIKEEQKNKFVSHINKLQNEREIIISNIKQLELKHIGDSRLSPNNSSIDEVIISLNRIGTYLDNKNNSLEQTLLSVQASYQLLQTKADEAKTIAEKERFEKEQVKKERIEIEKYLHNLKTKMKEEEDKFEKIVKDYESEAINQKLISDNIKQSQQDHISNLIADNKILRNQYDSMLADIKELKTELLNANEQKQKYLDISNKTTLTLEEKNKLVLTLQNQLEGLENTPTQQVGVQTSSLLTKNDEECQVNLYKHKDIAEKPCLHNKITSEDVIKINDNFDIYPESAIPNDNIIIQKPHTFQNIRLKDPPFNEVQILTANFEPTIDFVKNIYLKYKIQRLNRGRLEQCSIASIDSSQKTNNIPYHVSDNDETKFDNVFNEIRSPKNSYSKKSNSISYPNNDNIIDIYNTQVSTNSTKITGDIYIDSNKDLKILTADPENNIECFVNSDINNTVFKDQIDFNDSIQSTENDLFVIYKDSDSIYEEQTISKNLISSKVRTNKMSNKQISKQNVYISDNVSDDKDDDSIKPKLKINLPRVIHDSPSTMTISEYDRKSLESYTHAIYASTKRDVHSDTNIINNDSTHLKLNDILIHKKKMKEIVSEKVPIEQHFGKNVSKNIKSNKAKIIKEPKKNKNVAHNSNYKLSRVDANVLVLQNTIESRPKQSSDNFNVESDYGLQYILNAVQNEFNPNNIKNINTIKSLRRAHSDDGFNNISDSSHSQQFSPLKLSSMEYGTTSTHSPMPTKSVSERGTLVKMDAIEDYENKIQRLSNTLENIEKDYKKKIEAVKLQYDTNVKSIMKEHDHGVQSIQNLHEETLHDIIKIHENEVENLRTMSIEAMRKAERLEIENRSLKSKVNDGTIRNVDEDPIRLPSPDYKKRKCKCRVNSKALSKTNIEAFNIKPKRRPNGPCTCSLDMNISDTIRNIFEQVDVEQRKMAEQAYLKYIAHKMSDGNVETLDAQELSFLHLKVCRTWKTKINKEQALQKKIDSLESELINKQRQSQKHLAELDRKVAEEWHRLQEVREAVCRSSPNVSRDPSPASRNTPPVNAAEKDMYGICSCNTEDCNIALKERRSAGDLAAPGVSNVITACWKRKRTKIESNRAVLAKLDVEGHRDKGPVKDEPPTRLKRAQDRHNIRTHKK